jgi:hypothetical protein
MGFVKQGLVVGGFLVVVGCLCEGDCEGPRCFLFPQNAGRGERCGFLWVQSPSGLVVFLSERSLFFLPGEAFFTPTGKLLSASGQENCCACTMTYSGREEERAPSIYRAGSGDAQRRCRGCAVPKLS